jgi:hypothetical protein
MRGLVPKGFLPLVLTALGLVFICLLLQIDHMHSIRPEHEHESFGEQHIRVRLDAGQIQSTPVVIDAPPSTAQDSKVQLELGQEVDVTTAPISLLWAHGLMNFDPGGALGEGLPESIKAWRRAELDWHTLLPTDNSKFQRDGATPPGYELLSIHEKESSVTDFLTRYQASGLSSVYGHDHGALAEYAQCDVLADPCMVHSQQTCVADEFCTWDVANGECYGWHSQPTQPPKRPFKCSEPMAVVNGRFFPVANNDTTASCRRYVQNETVMVKIDGESQSMFYHWWAAFQFLFARLWLAELGGTRDVHFLMAKSEDTAMYRFLGTISNNCWRRAEKQVPVGTCFCNTHEHEALQSHGPDGPRAAAHVKQMMIGGDNTSRKAARLTAVLPALASQHTIVCLISRRKKRFVLNEFELCEAAARAGYVCRLLPLEDMTIYEQIKELNDCDVLVGIHGSGLDNSVFMRAEQTVLVQLMPYRNNFRASFPASTRISGVMYKEWHNNHENGTLMHWEFFKVANQEAYDRLGKEEIIRRGQEGFGNLETTMFWINQDTVVPLDEWLALLSDCADIIKEVSKKRVTWSMRKSGQNKEHVTQSMHESRKPQ